MHREPMVLALDTLPRKISTAVLAAAATISLSVPLLSQFRAGHYSRRGTLEGLERALAVQPENAEFHNRLGRVLLYSPLGDPARARAELERAVELEPSSGAYRVDMALARELEGDAEGAARELAGARRVEPRTPAVLWNQVNFELRRGSNERALQLSRELLEQAPNYAPRTLPLLARVTEPAKLIEETVPAHPEAIGAALEFLRVENHVSAAESAWARVMTMQEPPPSWHIRYFVDWLVTSGNADLARQVWRDSAKRGWIPVDAASSDDPFYNSYFDHTPGNFGFDWRVLPHPEASVWIEARGPQAGKQSLCVQFAGGATQDYSHVTHYIPVEPNFHYALRGMLRSERLFSRVGAYLHLREMAAGRADVTSEPVVGTSNWKEVAVRLETGPATKMVHLALIRPGTLKGEEPAGGMVCMAALRLEPLGPSHGPAEAVRTKR